MAGQFPRPIGSVAHVVALLVSGLSIGVPVDPASADDCLKAPNSAAPQGSHWYYRLDRANQRKCWYLRAPGQPAQQAAAPATSAAPTPSNSTPARSGPMAAAKSATAPTSITPGGSAPPSPHIKILAVTPKPAPVVGGTTDELVRQGPPKGNAAPAFPEVPAPQASTSSQTSAQAAGPVPAASAPWPDPRPAFATINAQEPVAVQTDAHADSVQPPARAHASDGEKGTPRGGEPANNAGLPVIIFPMLALGLVAAGALSRVGMNIVAARRARPIVHHPESDWDDDQRQHELRDHHEEYGSAELREYPSLTSAVRDYGPRIPFRADDEKANNARGHGDAGQILADDEWPDNAADMARPARSQPTTSGRITHADMAMPARSRPMTSGRVTHADTAMLARCELMPTRADMATPARSKPIANGRITHTDVVKPARSLRRSGRARIHWRFSTGCCDRRGRRNPAGSLTRRVIVDGARQATAWVALAIMSFPSSMTASTAVSMVGPSQSFRSVIAD